MSFYFLTALREQNPTAAITIITRTIYKDLFEYLPLDLKVIEVGRSTNSYWHRLLEIFSLRSFFPDPPDIYYALPPSLSSAITGWFIGAKKRIGMRGQSYYLRALFLNQLTKQLDPDRTSSHRAYEYLALLNWPRRSLPVITLKKQQLWADLAAGTGTQTIVININSEASSRRMPSEQWLSLLEIFKQSAYRILLIGSAKEEKHVQCLLDLLPKNHNFTIENHAGKTSIARLVEILSQASLMISNDSGPAHLSAILGTPTIVFFGAGDTNSTAPLNPKNAQIHIFSDHNLACAPCLKNNCKFASDNNQHLACLKNISMEDVARKIREFLLR
ncbi:MAG: glycosyltransferase family 9 protein [Oligoflexia bacterium]|nr:glycosyltransferase family 9 protein [Oligoflexia bacterium]